MLIFADTFSSHAFDFFRHIAYFAMIDIIDTLPPLLSILLLIDAAFAAPLHMPRYCRH